MAFPCAADGWCAGERHIQNARQRTFCLICLAREGAAATRVTICDGRMKPAARPACFRRRWARRWGRRRVTGRAGVKRHLRVTF